jgi:hypothetical protein
LIVAFSGAFLTLLMGSMVETGGFQAMDSQLDSQLVQAPTELCSDPPPPLPRLLLSSRLLSIAARMSPSVTRRPAAFAPTIVVDGSPSAPPLLHAGLHPQSFSTLSHRDVAAQVRFERAHVETRIDVQGYGLETSRFQAMG